ncbi:hypothetical protein AMECASPLE_032825 [Ameca splendens]|uniref:NTR domain-containing protein n=1 Tax=Ameca splendens TaxID=208324 RepID=A0ABV1AFP4_9TELE
MQKDPRPGIEPRTFLLQGNSATNCATVQPMLKKNCSKQRKENIMNEDRETKVCESTQTSKIDFVYQVIVESFSENYTTDSYSVRILKVFKQGTTDESPQGKRRTFLTYQHCREALDLKPSKSYLIMGSSSYIYKDDSLYQYVIGETTWVEYWPTPEECETEKYSPICKSMNGLEGKKCRQK